MRKRYYSLKNILECGAQYNVIFGERSNGKTFAVLQYGLKNFVKNKKQMAIIRRWQDDFTGKRGLTMFNGLVSAGEVAKITAGEWTDIYYYGSKWYLCRWEDGKRITDERPFCYGFAITSMEHDKSTSYPDITAILFDEFLTRSVYVNDEFVLFMNVLSTIIRDRTDVKIFMCGNTVNRYCPYFNEMGLKHIKDMKPGTIDVYEYGTSGLKVAVEYTQPNKAGKESDLYFAFDNPKLHMITGGAWEIDIYPHLPMKYRPRDIVFTYFIIFNGEALQCDVVTVKGVLFTYVHRKSGDIKHPEVDLVYTPEYSHRPNWRRKITQPVTPLDKRVARMFREDRVFYQDNEVGEIVRNYLLWCMSSK